MGKNGCTCRIHWVLFSFPLDVDFCMAHCYCCLSGNCSAEGSWVTGYGCHIWIEVALGNMSAAYRFITLTWQGAWVLRLNENAPPNALSICIPTPRSINQLMHTWIHSLSSHFWFPCKIECEMRDQILMPFVELFRKAQTDWMEDWMEHTQERNGDRRPSLVWVVCHINFW